MDALRVIEAKRDGQELSAAQIGELVEGFVGGVVPDYQMSAFLMASYLRGLCDAEAVALTDAFVRSGDCLDLSTLSGPTADKHSTGGVADATTLIVAPLAAELGLRVVKLSGRGLGHTGGTLDKLEAIPGMRTALSGRELLEQVERIGMAVGAQTTDLVPADRMVYALRDVTGTVANTALIASSIMSKKLAAGAASIVLDVKVGSGAFMKDEDAARRLAELCVSIGTAAGRATSALLTDMSQPLGTRIGNAIEMEEAIDVLAGRQDGPLREVSLALAGELAVLAGVVADASEGRRRAEEALRSGAGLERFARFVEAQGGDPRVVENPSFLPQAAITHDLVAMEGGWLAAVDAEVVGMAAARLGAGRRRKEDVVDPAVGVELPVKIGDRVEAGQSIGRVLARRDADARAAINAVQRALRWSPSVVVGPPVILSRIGACG